MVQTNEDLLTALGRAANKYSPEMYTPSGAELEHGLGSEPLVRLTLREGKVVAMCWMVDGGAKIMGEVYEVAEEGAPLPFADGKSVSVEGIHGEPPSIGALVEQIKAAADKLAH